MLGHRGRSDKGGSQAAAMTPQGGLLALSNVYFGIVVPVTLRCALGLRRSSNEMSMYHESKEALDATHSKCTRKWNLSGSGRNSGSYPLFFVLLFLSTQSRIRQTTLKPALPGADVQVSSQLY